MNKQQHELQRKREKKLMRRMGGGLTTFWANRKITIKNKVKRKEEKIKKAVLKKKHDKNTK
jgi:hypothetical protein